jgi:hypothetical protein
VTCSGVFLLVLLLHPYAERLAPLDFARGKLSEAEGSRGDAFGAHILLGASLLTHNFSLKVSLRTVRAAK